MGTWSPQVFYFVILAAEAIVWLSTFKVVVTSRAMNSAFFGFLITIVCLKPTVLNLYKIPHKLSKFSFIFYMNYVNFRTFTHTQQSGLDILYTSHLILKFLRVMNEPSALACALLLMLTLTMTVVQWFFHTAIRCSLVGRWIL